MDECSDPERKFYPFRRICYATLEHAAAVEAVNALRGDDANFHDGSFANWAKVRSDGFPYPAGAGETIGVANVDLMPWDTFTTDRDASPVRPSGKDEEVEPSHPTEGG